MLRAAAPHNQVRFEELPRLYFQLECESDGVRERWDHEKPADRKQSERDKELLVTPLAIEVRLPKEWREQIAVREARVAVLVLAKPVEFPRRGGIEILKAAKEIRVERPDTRPVWNGVVRTEFVELRFPPRLK
jgi:hypothetical protein